MRTSGGAVAWGALVTIAAFGGCGGSEGPPTTPTGARASCAVDADCTITDFATCCACCPGAAYASPVLTLSQRKATCAKQECPACSENVTCKPPGGAKLSDVVAKCKDHACVAVPAR
jgi:hypothetical protein